MTLHDDLRDIVDKLKAEVGWVLMNAGADRYEAAAVCALACQLLADDLLAVADAMAFAAEYGPAIRALAGRERLKKGGTPNSTRY